MLATFAIVVMLGVTCLLWSDAWCRALSEMNPISHARHEAQSIVLSGWCCSLLMGCLFTGNLGSGFLSRRAVVKYVVQNGLVSLLHAYQLL